MPVASSATPCSSSASRKPSSRSSSTRCLVAAETSRSSLRTRETVAIPGALEVSRLFNPVRHLSYPMGHMAEHLVAEALYRKAEAQSGYFTADQALEAGMSRTTLSHHARPRGRFERVATGLYRLRHFPASRNEHIMAAWLPLRHTGAVVSHASALELHELSDVIPTEVHLSLPRKRRGQRRRPGVRLHTVGSFPTADQLRAIAGLPRPPHAKYGAQWKRPLHGTPHEIPGCRLISTGT